MFSFIHIHDCRSRVPATKKNLRAGGALLKNKNKMEEEVPENPFQAYAHKTLAGSTPHYQEA